MNEPVSELILFFFLSVGGTNDITDKSSPTFFVERILRQKYNSVNKVLSKHFKPKHRFGYSRFALDLMSFEL